MIGETKSWFLKKINKTDKHIARLIKKRENPKNIRNKKGEVTTDTTEIKQIMRDYEQLHVNTVDNLEEMDMFLEMYNIPKLNQDEIENMNR